MLKRPDWDTYFMEITHIIAKRSNCLRRHVGAILVKDHRIITTGYNGAPPGMAHCDDLGGCTRERMGFASGEGHEYCRALHAEQNAVIQAAIMVSPFPAPPSTAPTRLAASAHASSSALALSVSSTAATIPTAFQKNFSRKQAFH